MCLSLAKHRVRRKCPKSTLLHTRTDSHFYSPHKCRPDGGLIGSLQGGQIRLFTESLKEGDAVQLVGFGTFKVNHRAERTGRNPQTGKEIKIAAANVPAFVSGKALKDAVK